VQAEGDQEQVNQDESVRGVEVGEDQAGHRLAEQNVAEGEGDMKKLPLVIIFNAPEELFNDVEIQDVKDYSSLKGCDNLLEKELPVAKGVSHVGPNNYDGHTILWQILLLKGGARAPGPVVYGLDHDEEQ